VVSILYEIRTRMQEQVLTGIKSRELEGYNAMKFKGKMGLSKN
jgi:hypothetical protein